MKKITSIIILFAYLFSLNIILASQKDNKYFSEKDMYISNIKIGSNYNDFIKKFGKPKKTKKDNQDEYLYYNFGYLVKDKKGNINEIAINSNTIAGPRGIKVGDKNDKIKQLFGLKNSYKIDGQLTISEDNKDILLYYALLYDISDKEKSLTGTLLAKEEKGELYLYGTVFRYENKKTKLSYSMTIFYDNNKKIKEIKLEKL